MVEGPAERYESTTRPVEIEHALWFSVTVSSALSLLLPGMKSGW